MKELLGHLYRDVDRIDAALQSEPPAAATHDSVTYFRSYDRDARRRGRARRRRPGEGGRRAVRDRPRARRKRGTSCGRGRSTARPRPIRARVVVTFGPALTFDEYLKTRVLEVTVHRMDLEDALGRRGWGTDTAVSIVDDILVGLLGTEPPRSLDWDVVDFIETGTGRRELTDAERTKLGVRLVEAVPAARLNPNRPVGSPFVRVPRCPT